MALILCWQALDPALLAPQSIGRPNPSTSNAAQSGELLSLLELWPVLLGLLSQSSAWSTIIYNAANDSLSGRIGSLAILAPALALASAQVYRTLPDILFTLALASAQIDRSFVEINFPLACK